MSSNLCNKWAKITDVRRRTFAWSSEKFKNLTWRLCRKTSEGLSVAWLLTRMFVLVFQVQRAIISEPKYYFDSSLFHFHCVGLFFCYQRSFLKVFLENCSAEIAPAKYSAFSGRSVQDEVQKPFFVCVQVYSLFISNIKFKEIIHLQKFNICTFYVCY